MAKSVGLEIHARGVRAVEVAGRGKSARVTRYMERDVTPRGGAPDPTEVREAIAEIFKVGRFSKNHVTSNIEVQETVVREIPVPFKSDDQIRKVVKYEAEHHLHDCDADDVIVQYTKVGESADGTNLLVFAARKDALSRRIEHARSVGIEPLAMDLDALAFYGAVWAAGMLGESPTCVLMNIGHQATGMVFVLDGEVRALRSARIGVDSITHGLARDMDIDFFEADSKMHELAAHDDGHEDLLVPLEPGSSKADTEKSHAELERDLFQQKLDEFLARLKREYVRSVAAMRGSGEPARILVTGPGVLVPGLLDLLGQRLGVSVEAFRPSQHFKCSLSGTTVESFDANAAVALGLALKGAGVDPLDIDFRQEELQVANKFDLLKGSLAVSVTLLFVALLAFSFYSVLKKRSLYRDRFDSMSNTAYQSFAEVATKYNGLGGAIVPENRQIKPGDVEADGPRSEVLRRYLHALNRMRNNLYSATGDKSGLEPITSALDVWNQIFTKIKEHHKEIEFIDFEAVTLRQDRVFIVVIVKDAGHAERLHALLSEIEYLKPMRTEAWQTQEVRGTDKFRVNFEWRARRT